MQNALSVDVIIPTVGRSSLSKAIDSVRDQTHGSVRLIVVLDDPRQESSVRELILPDDMLIVTSGSIGGGAARNAGLDASNSDLVAFLDDDDWWEPAKLEKQAEIVASGAASVVFTHTVFHQSDGSTRLLPEGPFDASDSVASYLVLRPGLRHGYGYMQSSSLLVDRRLHGHIRWDDTLPKHQDWDFIVALSSLKDSTFAFVELPLVHVQQGSAASISRKRTAEASQKWLDKHTALLSPRARGDFIATQVLRSQLASFDVRGAVKTCSVLARNRPHLSALIIGLSGTVEALKQRQ